VRRDFGRFLMSETPPHLSNPQNLPAKRPKLIFQADTKYPMQALIKQQAYFQQIQAQQQMQFLKMMKGMLDTRKATVE